MAASANSPAILPMSNPPPTETTSLHPTTTTTTTPLRTLLTSLSDTVRPALALRRPWTELLDHSAFSKPSSLSDATLRLRKNYAYFRINYLSLILSVLAISLITNPFSLILLSSLLAAWMFLYLFRSDQQPVTLFGRQYSDRETLMFLIVATVVVIFLTSVGSVLVSALMVGVAIVCVHGAFRDPEDLFLDEQEAQSGGLMSLLTAAAPPTVAAAQPAVAARV